MTELKKKTVFTLFYIIMSRIFDENSTTSCFDPGWNCLNFLHDFNWRILGENEPDSYSE